MRSSFLFILKLSLIVRANALPQLPKRSGTLPPVVSSVNLLGTAYDNNFPNVYRDNGGGGKVNGLNLIVFADTSVTNGGRNGELVYFVSNSVAVMNYVRSDIPIFLSKKFCG